MFMHNLSCIEKCECEYGKKSYDSHVLRYIERCVTGYITR